MSVVFPMATVPSVSLGQVPHRHPPFSFEVNFFLLYDFSGHSKQLFFSSEKPLDFTNTATSSFTEFTAQLSHQFPSVFDVSFSTQRKELSQWVISTCRATLSLFHTKKKPNNYICLQLMDP